MQSNRCAQVPLKRIRRATALWCLLERTWNKYIEGHCCMIVSVHTVRLQSIHIPASRWHAALTPCCTGTTVLWTAKCKWKVSMPALRMIEFGTAWLRMIEFGTAWDASVWLRMIEFGTAWDASVFKPRTYADTVKRRSGVWVERLRIYIYTSGGMNI